MSAGSRSGGANTPGTGDSTEESTPVRGASSERSALSLSRRLRPLPGSGTCEPIDRWCRRVAPQPPANGSGSLRDVDKDQGATIGYRPKSLRDGPNPPQANLCLGSYSVSNHYHLIFQTPEPNLVQGMGWFQNTWTRRFNVGHRRWGHARR